MTRTKDTITILNGGTTGTAKIHETGFIKTLIVITPNFTNPVTTRLQILDTDSKVLYTSNQLAENTENLGAGISVPVDYGFIISLLTSGDPGADGDVVVELFIDTAVRR